MTSYVEPTEFEPAAAHGTSPLHRPFGAGKATAAFLLLFVAQFLTGFSVVVIMTIIEVARGGDPDDPGLVGYVAGQALGPILLTSAVASILVIYVITRLWAWHLVEEKGAEGVGLVGVPAVKILAWAVVGIVLGFGYISTVHWVVPFDSGSAGPLAQAVAAGGNTLVAWAVGALFFAPITEEFFFRGLLLSGFKSSWGSVAGAVIVTVLFVASHLPETIHYWPATVAISLMAVAALTARRATGSLFPAMACHAGYNSVLVLTLVASFGGA
jgi:membrane protease YdiL (CAAX protease family)